MRARCRIFGRLAFRPRPATCNSELATETVPYEEVIYRQEVERLSAADSGLRVVHTLTRSQPANWRGYRRRVDGAMLAEVSWPASARPLVFICGPTRMVESVATTLMDLGYEPARVKTERFGPSGGS